MFLSLRKGRGGRIAPSIVSETLSAAQGALRFLVDFGVSAGEGIGTLRAHRRCLCCLGFLLCADLCVLHIHSAAQGEEGVAQHDDAAFKIILRTAALHIRNRTLQCHGADVQGGFPRGGEVHSLHRSTPDYPLGRC